MVERSTHAGFFLVGPTAVGKTEIAHYIAQHQKKPILSADSMLVFRDMNIGTAKPSLAQQQEIPYGGINLVTPDQDFSVGDYLKHARDFIYRIDQREVLVVGGTGLYIKCLLQGFDEMPAANPEIRKYAETIYSTQGLAALQEKLREKDLARYEALADKSNPRRLIRALELAHTQTPLAESWKQNETKPIVGLRIKPDELKQRIRRRVEKMFAEGLVDEARLLRENYRVLSKTALQAIGYAEAFAVLDGQTTEKEAIEKTCTRTRQLAKRQMTWFRHQANVSWIDIENDMTVIDISKKITTLWETYGSTPLHF